MNKKRYKPPFYDGSGSCPVRAGDFWSRIAEVCIHYKQNDDRRSHCFYYKGTSKNLCVFKKKEYNEDLEIKI
jgi:hypothetical protein